MLWNIFSYALMILLAPIWLPIAIYSALTYKHTDTYSVEEGKDNE